MQQIHNRSVTDSSLSKLLPQCLSWFSANLDWMSIKRITTLMPCFNSVTHWINFYNLAAFGKAAECLLQEVDFYAHFWSRLLIHSWSISLTAKSNFATEIPYRIFSHTDQLLHTIAILSSSSNLPTSWQSLEPEISWSKQERISMSMKHPFYDCQGDRTTLRRRYSCVSPWLV